MSHRQGARGFYERRGKRVFDVLAAGSALIVLLPVQGVVAILVRRNLGRPVLFVQTRPGLDEQPFEILKFRTMTDAVDAHGHALPDEERLTRFGQLLRSTSLDELPELWNVVKGRDEPCGPTAAADEVPAAIHVRASTAPRGAARRDRLGPGQRTQQRRLAREVGDGCLVYGTHLPCTRSEDPSEDHHVSGPARGRVPGWPRDGAGVHGRLTGYSAARVISNCA